MTGLWPQPPGEAFQGQSVTMMAATSAEGLLHKNPQFSAAEGHPSALAVKQQQRAPAAAPQQKPQQRVEEVGEPALCWRGSGPWRRQVARALLWSPCDCPSSQAPERVQPSSLCPEEVLSSPSSRVRPFPQGWLHFLATNHGLWPLRR